MDTRLVLVQSLIALLTVAVSLGMPRIRDGLDARAKQAQDKVLELDDFAQRVRALSKRIQRELVFPHIVSLKTVEPVHDLLYGAPRVNPDPEALGEMLRIGQRARELNFGPRQILLWTFSYRERIELVEQLATAESRFVASYWRVRDMATSGWAILPRIRRAFS